MQAHKGTLFLDEIGAMSLNMQTKLLKSIEEKSFYPVGCDRSETSEFRIISATLEDFQRLLAQRRLRLDFFQRIHGFTLNLKPLARRRCDILPLIKFFTRGGRRLSFSPEANACLLNHDWPGNTRELKRFVELLVAGQEGLVTPAQVRRHLASALNEPPAGGFVTGKQYQYALSNGLDKAVELLTSEVIRRRLDENQGKKTKTMADLKISTRLLYSALRRGGLEEVPHETAA